MKLSDIEERVELIIEDRGQDTTDLSWCGCHEGDLGNDYPFKKEQVVRDIMALIEHLRKEGIEE